MGTSFRGGLIAESLRVGAVLADLSLTVTRVSRADVGDVDAGQPRTWTFLDFELAADGVEAFAGALCAALSPVGGWYCDFRSDTESYVVFADRVFHHPRHDAAGRAEAEAYARSVGVPEAQIDWPA